ncbi:MAG: hypothetical protein P4L82_22580 [Ancalomicrobiaceae bacterium]|nr:hypothetical protein [Ancalomicrobiaceae bacterium]
MKLTSEAIETTVRQIDVQPVPDDHPVVQQFNILFGDHTFFVDSHGLNIVEPDKPADGMETGRIIRLASWTDETRTKLEKHDPQRSETVVMLGRAA